MSLLDFLFQILQVCWMLNGSKFSIWIALYWIKFRPYLPILGLLASKSLYCQVLRPCSKTVSTSFIMSAESWFRHWHTSIIRVLKHRWCGDISLAKYLYKPFSFWFVVLHKLDMRTLNSKLFFIFISSHARLQRVFPFQKVIKWHFFGTQDQEVMIKPFFMSSGLLQSAEFLANKNILFITLLRSRGANPAELLM